MSLLRLDSFTQGTGVFNFNGGTLRATGSDDPGATTDPSTFFGGVTTANVRGNGTAGTGANIDTAGYNVTVSQTLVHSTIPGDKNIDGGLTKLGAGTLTLAGANTYNGPTTVSAGTLKVANASGSATGTGTVNILSGAILGGNGTISGPVVAQNGGTLDPSLSTATARLSLGGNLTFSGGSTLGVELGATTSSLGYSQLQVAGRLTLGCNLRVTTLDAFRLAVGQVFVIVQDTGGSTVVGVFANATGPGNTLYTDAAGNTFVVNYAANTDGGSVGNDVTLRVQSVVPEPSTWMLLSIGATGWILAMRRHRRQHVAAA